MEPGFFGGRPGRPGYGLAFADPGAFGFAGGDGGPADGVASPFASPFAGGPASPFASEPASPLAELACHSCGGELARGAGGAGLTCAGCALIFDTEEEDAPPPRFGPARLRLVGPGSSTLTLNLYLSGSEGGAEAREAQTASELAELSASWVARGGGRAGISGDICREAAKIFSKVQRVEVKRSMARRNIMAACIFIAGLNANRAIPKPALAGMLRLPSKGIATGMNYLLAFEKTQAVPVGVNTDPSEAEIRTLFVGLGLEGPKYDGLRAAVGDIVRTAVEKHIGVHSVLRSKVAGATFAVLQRCRDPALVARPPTFAEFCRRPGAEEGAATRKNTVENFTDELAAYHSHFEAAYRRAGLDPAPPAPRARGRAR